MEYVTIIFIRQCKLLWCWDLASNYFFLIAEILNAGLSDHIWLNGSEWRRDYSLRLPGNLPLGDPGSGQRD